jgi:hypothetical protein
MEKQMAISLCMQHMHRYVAVQLADGSMFDGIVVEVDEEHLHLAVPFSGEMRDTRAWFGPGYGFGFGYPYGYPYGGYPYGYFPRRFNPLILPLAALLTLSLLPYY